MPFQRAGLRDVRAAGRTHHRRAARDPAPLGGQPDRRQLTEQRGCCRSRTSRSADCAIRWSSPPVALCDGVGRGPDWGQTGSDPSRTPALIHGGVGIVEVGPQLATALLQHHRRPQHRVDRDAVEARGDGRPASRPASSSDGRSGARTRTGWGGRRGTSATTHSPRRAPGSAARRRAAPGRPERRSGQRQAAEQPAARAATRTARTVTSGASRRCGRIYRIVVINCRATDLCPGWRTVSEEDVCQACSDQPACSRS